MTDDFRSSDDNFESYDSGDDDFLSPGEKVDKVLQTSVEQYEHILDIRIIKTKFKSDIALKLFNSPPLHIDLLYQYTEHDDSYEDLGTKGFKKWYEKDGNDYMCKLFLVGALEKYHEMCDEDSDSPCLFSLNDYKGMFRAGRLGMFKDEIKNGRIYKSAPPRLGRMLNVWLRLNFPADGFGTATMPLTKRFPACQNCGSVFNSETGLTEPGEKWLRLLGQD